MPDRSAAQNADGDERGAGRACAPARSRRPRAPTRRAASHVGDAVGYVGDELVAWGAAEATLTAVLDHLSAGGRARDLISGEGAPLDHAAIAGLAPDGVELELCEGGQPSRWWLLSAE